MRKILTVLVPVLICFGVGFTASYFQMDAIHNWYPYLDKSVLTPPDIVFPIAWSILYVCMGISIGLVMLVQSEKKNKLVTLFALQLFFNFAWSFLFFYLQNPLLGLIDILMLDAFVTVYAVKSHSVNKISSYLFIPYLLWIYFATYLNAYILVNY